MASFVSLLPWQTIRLEQSAQFWNYYIIYHILSVIQRKLPNSSDWQETSIVRRGSKRCLLNQARYDYLLFDILPRGVHRIISVDSQFIYSSSVTYFQAMFALPISAMESVK